MLKILQARLQEYMNREFREGRGTGDQIAHTAESLKKPESSRKKYLLLLY